MSTNITYLTISDTMLEELSESIRCWSRLQKLRIYGSAIRYPVLPKMLLGQSVADIERIPDCIKDLHGLKELYIAACPKLASLPELPRSLISLLVDRCETLETLFSFPFDSQIEELSFPNCIKLGGEARRVITQQPLWGCLPGRTLPAEFHHRAFGNFLSIRSNVYGFKFCVAVSPKQEMVAVYGRRLWCRICINGCPIEEINELVYMIESEHLIILHSKLLKEDGLLEENSEILFEFSTTAHDIEIIECGVQVLDGKNQTESEAAREAMNLDQNMCLIGAMNSS